MKLRDLILFSDYDRIFRERYLRKRQKLMVERMLEHSFQVLDSDVDPEEHKKLPPPYESWPDLMPSLLSDGLEQIASLNSDDDVGMLGIKSKRSVKLSRPKHPNAKRSYFIKKLTQFLREKTGQPLRDIVTITTATVFDDPGLTERQIIRIAP